MTLKARHVCVTLSPCFAFCLPNTPEVMNGRYTLRSCQGTNMKGDFMRRIFQLALCLTFIALLTGCPDSGGAGSGPPDSGTWSGTLMITGTPGSIPGAFPGAGSYTVHGAILKDGYGFFYDAQGDYFQLPVLGSSGNIDGAGTEYWTCGTGFYEDSIYCNYGLQQFGQTGGDTLLIGTTYPDLVVAKFDYYYLRSDDCAVFNTCARVGAAGSTFDLTKSQTYSDTPRIIPGHWVGQYNGGSATSDVLVQSDGSFAGSTDLGCSLTGTITQPQPGVNAFSVILDGDRSGLGEGCIPKNAFKGVGYLTDKGTGKFAGVQGTYFVMGYSSDYTAFVVEYKVQ
jgi:hypothetical protein